MEGGDLYPYGLPGAINHGDMTDAPGAGHIFSLQWGILVELYSCAVCTKGRSAGVVIGCRRWGVEVGGNSTEIAFPLTHRHIRAIPGYLPDQSVHFLINRRPRRDARPLLSPR